MRPIRATMRLGAAVGICTGLLVLPAGASAALVPSAPIALDAPQATNITTRPIVQYDPVSGATFVAWSNPDQSGVELCVLSANAANCGTGPELLTVPEADNPDLEDSNIVSLQGLVVAPDGAVTVTGESVDGGTVAWSSPADGSAFRSADQGLQNGGFYISPIGFTFDNVVALGNSDVGILDPSQQESSDSPVAGPESPPIPSPNSNQSNGGLFRGPGVGVDGPLITAQPTSSTSPDVQAVVAVGDQFGAPDSAVPSGCSSSAATGFGSELGEIQSQSNATLAQGIPAYTLLACSAENPTVSAGSETSKAPIGVLEDEGDGVSGTGHTYVVAYHHVAGGGVDPAHPQGELFFSKATDLIHLTTAAENLALADDPGEGVYAVWYANPVGAAGFYEVDYSADDGVTWEGPEKISDPHFPTLTSVLANHFTLTGVGHGSFDTAYAADAGKGTVTYLQRFNYGQPAPVTASIGPTATSTSTTITVTTSCSVTPCTVTTTITTSTTTTTTELRRATSRPGGTGATKGRMITLATGRFTITKPGKHLLKLKWNATGRRLIAKHRTLRATVDLSTRTAGGTKTSSHALSITRK